LRISSRICEAVAKTRGVIERSEGRFVVDVQPFAAAIARETRCSTNKLEPDSAMTILGIDSWVEEEGVFAAAGRDVDESDRPSVDKSADESEAALEDSLVAARNVVRPRAIEQVV